MIIADNRSRKETAPLFSIITVVRNSHSTVSACVTSVELQRFRSFEHIVIDGDSTDGTLEILKSYKDLFSYCISEPDDGIQDAYNKAIALARGKYIGILNADDEYFPDTLKIVAEQIESKRIDSGVIYGAIEIMKDPAEYLFVGHNELGSRMICHPASFVSKDVYNKIGNYDTKYRIAADYDFMVRCFQNEVFFLGITEVLAKYRPGGISEKLKKISMRETIQIQSRINNWNRVQAEFFYTKLFLATLAQPLKRQIENRG